MGGYEVEWHHEADIVVIGSGATGMPAAIVAREAGASVIVVEAEPHIGGHAMVSGGNVPLGGGTAAQIKHGITDTPDLEFRDLTDWSVVGTNGFPDYRYNDREVVRAFADNSVAAFDWLVAHGVTFADKPPDDRGGVSVGNSVPREMHCALLEWPMAQTGAQGDPAVRTTFSTGNGLMNPLAVVARRAGVEILLEHRMTALHRETPNAGRVLGIEIDHRAAPRATSAPAAASSSPPAARPAMSSSAACSTRASPRNIAASPACPIRTRTPAASLPAWRWARRSGASSTRPARSASPSPRPA